VLTGEIIAQRPCSRCLSNGKEDTCVDVQHKKRGRPRLRDDNQARYEGVGPGYPAPSDVSMRRPLSLFSPSDTQIAHSFGDPLHRSSSYRVLKSQGGPGPMGGPVAPRYLEHALQGDANMYPAPMGPTPRSQPPQDPICAYLTMEMQVAKASPSFGDTVGLPSVISRRFQDIVIPNDREKVARLQRGFEDERRDREPNYLPPIYLVKFEEDRVIQSVGFSPEEISGIVMNRQEMFTFQGQDGQQRVFQVRLGLAKRESTYFIVLQLQMPATPQIYQPTSSPFSREPYPQDSRFTYQTPQHNYLRSQAPSPFGNPRVSLPPIRDQHLSLPPLRQSSAREFRYGYQVPRSELTAFVSKPSQHDSDAASPSAGKITTKHLKSPSSMPPMESSHSHTNFSSDCDDETDWDEDELSPSPQNIDPGNLSDGGNAFEERDLSPTKRKLVEDIMKEFWAMFNQEEGGHR
jgi:hypothetical protein